MKNLCVPIYAGLLLAAASTAALAQAQPAPEAATDSFVLVTADNFNRAESDLLMASIVKDGGSASTCTTESYTRSMRPSSVPTATLFIRFRSLTWMPAR